MITERELKLIRTEQEKFLSDRCIIKRREFLGDTEGEYFPIDEDIHPVRIIPGFGFWRTVADRFQGITAVTATFRWDENVQPGDALVVADESTLQEILDNPLGVVAGVKLFEVRDVRAPSSYPTAKQCLCDDASGD